MKIPCMYTVHMLPINKLKHDFDQNSRNWRLCNFLFPTFLLSISFNKICLFFHFNLEFLCFTKAIYLFYFSI